LEPVAKRKAILLFGRATPVAARSAGQFQKRKIVTLSTPFSVIVSVRLHLDPDEVAYTGYPEGSHLQSESASK